MAYIDKRTFVIPADRIRREPTLGSTTANISAGKTFTNVNIDVARPASWVTNGDTATANYVHGGLSGEDQSDPYITLDLGQIYALDTIKVWHYNGDSRTYYNTQTQVSLNGVDWITVFDGPDYAESSAGKTHSFSPILARYMRDKIEGSTANTGNHWVEIQVFGTTDYTTVDSLTDFPITINFNSNNFDFTKVRADGFDIEFFDSEDSPLIFEREHFDQAGSSGIFHVKIPSLSIISEKRITIKHNDAGQSTDKSDSNNVWDSNYVMVQHMGNSLIDSTGNGNDLNNSGAILVDGQNGKARSFDGVTQYMNDVDFSLGTNPLFTVLMVWTPLATQAAPGPWGLGAGGVSQQTISSYNLGIAIGFDLWGQTTMHGEWLLKTENEAMVAHWIKKDGADFGSEDAIFYKNGNSANITVTRDAGTIPALTDGFALGRIGATSDSHYCPSIIDEVRISNIVRSSEWIDAEYKSLFGLLGVLLPLKRAITAVAIGKPIVSRI